MFFLVPGFSVAAKCTVIGVACVAVAAADVLQTRSLLESFKTKASSAFTFKRGAVAKPSEHLSKAHSVPVAAEVDSNDSPNITHPLVCSSEENLSVFDVLETRAPDKDNEIIKASFSCIDVPEDEVSVRSSSTLEYKLSVEAVVDGDRDADVKTKAVCMAAIGDHHLDPIVEKNAQVMTDAVKAQLVSANNPNGRSWASRVFKGTRDLVMSTIRNIRSGISWVFNHTRDFLKGLFDSIRSWFGKMYGTVYSAVCAQGLQESTKYNTFLSPKVLAVVLRNWILDNQVILKKIMMVGVDFFVETISFRAHPQSRRLLMRLYRLLTSELIRC